MAAERLDDAAIDGKLQALSAWQRQGDALVRGYRFADFRRAFAFMTEVAEVAEDMQHHPDWTNVYSRVDVSLSTHDAGGITQLDFDLAAAMDRAAARHDGS